MDTLTPTPPVLRSDDGPVRVLTLHRPERMNALSVELVEALESALEAAEADAAVRVLILTAAGERAFCAGADLKERATMPEEQVRRFVPRLQALAGRLAAMTKPTIAAVQGAALGGGLELALACDLRFAAATATLGLTEVRLGIIPGAGGTQRLGRLVGPAIAKELVLTGRRIGADEAARLGVVNAVVEPAALLSHAMGVAREIAEAAPLAVAAAKFAIDAGLGVDLATGLQIERKAYETLIPTHDRVEALRAFAERRAPRFEGR
jgi:enoyl-CoA hydratase/carnithine racemase